MQGFFPFFENQIPPTTKVLIISVCNNCPYLALECERDEKHTNRTVSSGVVGCVLEDGAMRGFGRHKQCGTEWERRSSEGLFFQDGRCKIDL